MPSPCHLTNKAGLARSGLLAALLCATLLGLLPAQGQAAMFKIRMACLQNDLHHLGLWIALEKGFFSQQGLEVEVTGAFQSGPELMTVFASGGLDAAYVGEAPASIAAIRGRPRVRVLAQANTEGSALIGSKNFRANSTGKLTLAIPGNGTVQDLLLRKALPLLGLAPEQVTRIVLGPPDMLTALQTGDIDAFLAWEPHPSRALALGVGVMLASSAEIWPEHPCCVLIVEEKFLREHPAEARALLQAHRQATHFARTRPDEAVAIAVRWTGMDEAVVRQALTRVNYTEVPSVAGEREYVDFLIEAGLIKLDDPAGFVEHFIVHELHARPDK